MRAPALHAHTRERRTAADFAFCNRCFLCVLLPLFFSTLSPSTHIHTFALPHAWRARYKKKFVYFLPSFFCTTPLYAIQRDFWGPFPRDCLPAAIYDANQSGPLPSSSFFIAQNSRRSINDSGNRVVEPLASVHSNEALVRSFFRKIYCWRSKVFFSRKNVKILIDIRTWIFSY